MDPHSFSNLHMKAKWNKNIMLFLCFPGEPTSFITGLFACLAILLGARESYAATLPNVVYGQSI